MDTFNSYYLAIEPIEAQQQMIDLQISWMANVDKKGANSRKKLFQSLKRQMKKNIQDNTSKGVTIQDVARTLARGLGLG